ncbi:hypothetical protein DFQ26_007839 [Actinomortierella ambigua]|nr:hypothetical protein DFQ26_007839 [Actinomortierella ambigua]
MADNTHKALDVTIHRAQDLDNVEKHGRQDPYVRLFLGLHDPEKCTVTTYKKNAGEFPVWEERLTLEHLKEETHILYVEIMDHEKVTDRIIAFTAIPLSQVREWTSNSFTGNFDVYNRECETRGTISLTLCIRDRDEPAHTHTLDSTSRPHKGRTTLIPEHKKRIGNLAGKTHVSHPIAAAANEAVIDLAAKVIAHSRSRTEPASVREI